MVEGEPTPQSVVKATFTSDPVTSLATCTRVDMLVVQVVMEVVREVVMEVVMEVALEVVMEVVMEVAMEGVRF